MCVCVFLLGWEVFGPLRRRNISEQFGKLSCLVIFFTLMKGRWDGGKWIPNGYPTQGGLMGSEQAITANIHINRRLSVFVSVRTIISPRFEDPDQAILIVAGCLFYFSFVRSF